jgi:signal transduction histidine kinase
MVLLSDRVRLYTRRFVSRHFQRPLYDYRAVWRTFIEGTARRVEQTELCEAVVKLVSDTFHALSVSIWVLEERKQKLIFAASTSLSKTKADHLVLETSEAAQVIGGLSIELNPIDLDISKQPWASALRRLQPSEFPNGGNRVCVPLFSGGELLGVILLCDRVGGTPFLDQDFDLLKSISDQAAASLLNIQLSQKVLQAKQLEAFQSMSAFFVHDLKNTASTLSLMLQNLPVHFADPQFREDALRGVSKTVTHINDLISRLSLLRQELTTRTADCDLNELVKSVVGGEDLAEGLRKPGSNKTQEPRSASTLPRSDAPALFHPVTLDLRPVPRVRVDHGQIQNVLTNLVLNAREAIGADGRITVQTARRNGWIILSVSDNGCGMSRDFIDRSLFRPFQSTKKKGIGIGMFQCKIIVEAHGGQIEVESEPGKGTSFRVLLPVAPEVNH